MEFIHTQDDEEEALLLLIVRLNKKIVVQLYGWDCARGLDSLFVRWQGWTLHSNLGWPYLLIPYTVSTGFLIVCEKGEYEYKFVDDATGGPCALPRVPAQGRSDQWRPESPANSGDHLVWTGWGRAFRRSQWSSKNEWLFLCREDGAIRLIALERYSPTQLSMRDVLPGRLSVNIDTAFAVLDCAAENLQPDDERGSFDMLLAAGNMSDGGLFLFKVREEGVPYQTVPNWTPVLDFGIVPGASRGVGYDQRDYHPMPRQLGDKDRIFSCSGRDQKHGAVCEIRSGVEARIVDLAEAPEFVGTTQLWLLPDPNQMGIYTLAANEITHFQFDPEAEEAEEIHPLISSIIDLDSTTLAATRTASDILVQITTSAVRAISCRTRPPFAERVFSRSLDDNTIAKASIDTYTSSALVVLRDDRGNFALCLLELRCEQANVNLRDVGHIEIPAEPSCLTLQSMHDAQFGFIGTHDSSLYVSKVYPTGLHRAGRYRFQGEFSVCESVCIIQSPSTTDQRECRVLCGLRDGTLRILRMAWTDDSSQ